MSYRFDFDYYEVLGLKRDCTLADIKKSFKKLAIIYHPVRTSQTFLILQFRIKIKATQKNAKRNSSK